MTLFAHLLEPEFGVYDVDPPDPPPPSEFPVPDPDVGVSLDAAAPLELVSAQAETVSWLDAVGAHTEDPPQDPSIEEAAKAAARAAFCSVTDPYQDPLKAKSALMTLRAPPAVRHLAGMLTQYDWNYVEQAQQIRGFVVARLIEHSRSADPKTSLPALKALGTVTEVGAFTERIEIARPPSENTADAIVARLRERLTRLLPPAVPASEISDAVIVPAPDAAP
jgi:hypothetical protein